MLANLLVWINLLVQTKMSILVHDHQVLDAIVERVSIDMMDMLKCFQLSAK